MKILFAFFFGLAAISTRAQEIKKIKITDLEKTMNDSNGPLVVTFWATYCIPCLKEIPHFQEIVKKNSAQKITLLLVSVDLEEAYPADIIAIKKKLKLTAPISWLDETDADYFCPKVDSNWSGALPATLFLNNAKNYRKFIEDELSKEEFEKQLRSMIAGKLE